MKRTLLLLHGFKKTNIDDFEELHEYFDKYSDQYEIINETYSDNYDKETLTSSYARKQVDRICKKLKDSDEVLIVAYSTGSIIAGMIYKKLANKNIKILSIVPPVKIHFNKWVPMGLRIMKKNSKLKKKLGKERYNRLKEKQLESKTIEKYPVKITIYINNLRLKYRKEIIKANNVTFLLSDKDTFVNTDKIIKVFDKKRKEYTVKSFDHRSIMTQEKQIFIEWFENKV